jgi:hypothetical protein
VRLLALAATALAAGFHGSVRPLDASLRAELTGRSWKPGCPVALADLRLLELTHWGFDGRVHTGRLVVNEDVANDVVSVFRRLYGLRFPVRRMRLVDEYGASDYRSIEADNTSAFNCRRATGSAHWSEHAYGHAIDLNPLENPYVSGGRTSHGRSVPYLDRTRALRGVVVAGGPVVAAFRSIGWGWGGDWAGDVKDYQHFSVSGR